MRKKYGKTLQDMLKYRIVWIVMKLKQKIGLLFIPILMVSTLAIALISPPNTVEALTESENKKCFQDWASQSPSQGKINRLKESKCYKANGSGQCKVEEERGSSRILCKRSDGSFATSGNYKVADSGDTDTDDTGDTGDDGTGTAVPTSNVDGDDCGGVKTAIIKCDAKNSGELEDNGVWALLIIALNILTAGVGIIAIAGIVYGAVLYTTAEDKADQVKKATDIITNVVIGLIAFALMWAGLNFIVPGGVFA